MKNYKVSVIVNCLNGERFVNRSIKSILNQNYQNFEIIFWDNKSIDNSLKIVKKLQKKRNKIRIFSSKKTIKLYEARNKAIEKAKGRYIAFLDIDDTWFKKKLSSQIKKIQSDQTKIIYTNSAGYTENDFNTYNPNIVVFFDIDTIRSATNFSYVFKKPVYMAELDYFYFSNISTNMYTKMCSGLITFPNQINIMNSYKRLFPNKSIYSFKSLNLMI